MGKLLSQKLNKFISNNETFIHIAKKIELWQNERFYGYLSENKASQCERKKKLFLRLQQKVEKIFFSIML